MSDYTPEKWIWTEADFDRMGWHDVNVHAFAFRACTLSFDLDYMFRWVDPAPGETYYKFWMSPSTLVFAHVSDVRLDLTPHGAPIIMGLTRSEPAAVPGYATTWQWSIDCLDGEVAFRATGYRQFTRRAPVLVSAQYFSGAERGGISFARVTLNLRCPMPGWSESGRGSAKKRRGNPCRCAHPCYGPGSLFTLPLSL